MAIFQLCLTLQGAGLLTINCIEIPAYSCGRKFGSDHFQPFYTGEMANIKRLQCAATFNGRGDNDNVIKLRQHQALSPFVRLRPEGLVGGLPLPMPPLGLGG